MVREWSITIYLFVFRFIFTICKIFPQKKKTTFVASFGDNILYTVEELEKQTDVQVVILKTAQCKIPFEEHPDRIVLLFEPKRPFQWLRSIYHLATSTHIFVDNYFGFLAATHFKPNVRCIQLWHAVGAIKQFGLKDPSIHKRSPKARRRFKEVYDRFTHVVVGSEKMAEIFQQSFGLPDERMLRTGVPRTDFFFDSVAQQMVMEQLLETYPFIRGKKVILYAPTFRDNALHLNHIALDLKKMYEALHEDYVLLLRLHPAVTANWTNEFKDFVYDVSHYPDVNHLLVITDILITDYSSIPFEYALFHQPMIFYAYDLEEYKKSRGFWGDYYELVPGPVAHTTEEILTYILQEEFDIGKVIAFSQEWNEYSNGNSSYQLIQALYTETVHSTEV